MRGMEAGLLWCNQASLKSKQSIRKGGVLGGCPSLGGWAKSLGPRPPRLIIMA